MENHNQKSDFSFYIKDNLVKEKERIKEYKPPSETTDFHYLQNEKSVYLK